jgi:CHAT domain-containing protein
VASLRFDPLPATSAEIADLAKIWGSQRVSQEVFDSSDVLRLEGSSADESSFKHNVDGRKVVHIATHGFFADGSCRSASSSMPQTVYGPENPLLTSGLAFAGANRPDLGPGGDDGLLTAEEVASLDLHGVEWVVLSACETALGKPVPGEGLLGLRRAFAIAGARTLIASLWRVEDDATRHWMRELYLARASGVPTDAAVEHASLALLAERRREGKSTHPFYWGGFIASGDWR